LVEQVADWPYSTFHRYVSQGLYPAHWSTPLPLSDVEGERHEIHAVQYG